MPAKKDKMQEDFSAKVDAVLPEQEKLAKEGKLSQAVENLLALEKQTRQAEDATSTSRVAVAIVRLSWEVKDLKALNENLQILSKRRGQLRTVIQDFVKEAIKFLDEMDKPAKLQLIDNLRTITEGKMFVEIERARLTNILAKIKEEEGKVAEAADILQEVQVETFGQMDKLEKTEFILEQMRLMLGKKDFIKAFIISNKISRKALKEPEFEDIKIRFYGLLNQQLSHDHKYLDISKSYYEIYDTPKVQADQQLWSKALELAVIYVVLSPYNNEQHDLANRLLLDKKLEQLPLYKTLLKSFLTKEIMRWPAFESGYRQELGKHSAFTELVDGKNQLWNDFRNRVVEHNIRVIAGYYSKITMKRLTQLLDLSEAEAEKYVSDLVTNKSIFARIDRPKGLVSFRKTQHPNESLNAWSRDVADLLDLVEKTCHLIHRENMVHKIQVE
ncbi:26S proteasome non-ATPase regulatory subunit 12-like isoform 1 [Planoprotostelium fungivorum]|uniref:26S proteasome non-ATPase regulatory subunit 12-like isoform 1 n=1 Tax=Planoprotostelium fungivorum TaxID=1890364 RepID=A0A2P6MSG3_9EUKA|nr:26S proteasome non-ATPase regulatory subunit 12-like isoform 1 [Planoprotostelium fungivorum]